MSPLNDFLEPPPVDADDSASRSTFCIWLRLTAWPSIC